MSEKATTAYGLPEALPQGERVLWQGRPGWRALALSAFHVRKVAIYFAVLIAWFVASSLADGLGISAAASSSTWLLVPAAIALCVLAVLAWLAARTTRYTITSRRILLQFGMALPMTLNIPLRVVGSADLKMYRDGAGDISLATVGEDRLAYLLLWPHARPWRIARPEPTLRALPGAGDVAAILAKALAAANAEIAASPRGDRQPEASTTAPPSYVTVAA